ncbi:MAG TPA: sigma-70 family RNA polymerase sigma factor [Pseudonocardiaceae bacterium]|jgi:RNA polymerase sigma factor (sigma-70 family)|nr:sigma-70 family RNA polymerase sigma factor [Pseudonocardiaceae bacterium]
MRTADEPDVDMVLAARDGRPDALEALVAAYLPLVYNIVGRAVGGHPDTDDIVQDTMLRALDGLPGLRDPASFRSWLVVIAMRQVRNRYRATERFPASGYQPDEVADPGADFVDLTIARLQLVDQRRELVEATRWLGDEDRELLSLWWLEAADQLTRTEVAAGVGLSMQHTAVRVQRMKSQLDSSRAVVRALDLIPRCGQLDELVADWDCQPNPLWRKRIVRHTKDCVRCQECWSGLVPMEGLLARLPVVPLPVGFALPGTALTHLGRTTQAHTTALRHATGHGRRAGRLGRLWAHAAAKPIVAGVVALAAAGAVIVLPAHHNQQPTSDALPLAVPTTTSQPATSTNPTTTAPTTSSTTVAPTTTTAPPTTTRAPVVVPPPAQSSRKGVSTWYFDGVTSALHDVGASWYYNWSSTRSNITAPAGVEYVPMIWGAGSVTASTLAQAKQQGSELLGFNEPDESGQANMSVSQALDLWPQLEATGMRLGSPAVAFGGDTPGGWLDQFMSGAATKGYRVDFITLHWYGSDFGSAAVGQLESYVKAVYNRYHKPIWLTEYALINFGSGAKYPTQAQQAAFATGSTAMLDSLSYVERYAWFALPSQGDDTGLYSNGTTPTQVGVAYRAAK